MFVQDHADREWHKLSRDDNELLTLCGAAPEGEHWGRATGSLPTPTLVEPSCRRRLTDEHRKALFHGDLEPPNGKE